MSITQIYTTDEFFETINPHEFKIGQICWVPVPELEPIPRILDVQRNNPEEHDEVKFELRLANRNEDFKQNDRSLPIKYLDLRAHEELLVQKCKKRPAIILTSKVDCFSEIATILKQKGKKHQQQDCMFVIPCYEIQLEEYGTGFIPQIVARAQCLMYRQFFYIPRSKRFGEQIARFDRIQVVIDRSPASIESSDVSLSKEVVALFLSMFIFCISGKTNENLDAVKELLKDAYPE